MKKLLGLFLIILHSNANAITPIEFSKLFTNYNACFIIYDIKKKKIISQYNPNNRCNERIAPDSTFKIPLSLIAFDQKLITQHTVFKWDGKKRELPDWNQDQTPESWLKHSALWVSQEITPQLGSTLIKHYLADFNYGNQNFNGDPDKNNGLTRAWLSSSLKISANEQLNFLISMFKHKLPISTAAINNTKKNLYLGKLNNGSDLYGKTGSGSQGNQLRDGWFVGFVEKGSKQYVFVSNLTDKQASKVKDNVYGSQILKPIAIKVLNETFIK